MKKLLFITLSLPLLLAAGCQKTTSAQTPVNITKSYSMADIANHNSQSSCWTAINGNVYDITSYLPVHPGGLANILQVCGKDGTSLFENQHGSDKKPNQTLTRYQIGLLQQ